MYIFKWLQTQAIYLTDLGKWNRTTEAS